MPPPMPEFCCPIAAKQVVAVLVNVKCLMARPVNYKLKLAYLNRTKRRVGFLVVFVQLKLT